MKRTEFKMLAVIGKKSLMGIALCGMMFYLESRDHYSAADADYIMTTIRTWLRE